jgi:hypothetical protein
MVFLFLFLGTGIYLIKLTIYALRIIDIGLNGKLKLGVIYKLLVRKKPFSSETMIDTLSHIFHGDNAQVFIPEITYADVDTLVFSKHYRSDIHKYTF